MRYIRKVYPKDLTVKQIHYLLVEKRRAVRHARLERFHRMGRMSFFTGEAGIEDDIRHQSAYKRTQITRPRTWMDGILLCAEFLVVIGLAAIAVTFLSTLVECMISKST